MMARNVPVRLRHPNGSVVRQDARTPQGGPAGSCSGYLIGDLLDRHAIEGALLNCFDAGGLSRPSPGTRDAGAGAVSDAKVGRQRNHPLNEAPRRATILISMRCGRGGWELVAVLPNGVANLNRELNDDAAAPRGKSP
jgi:hypothetical protein